MLVETDFLLSLVSPGDRNHARTVGIVERYAGELKLSPYALIELDMLLKSGRVVVENVPAFYAALGELLKFRGIVVYLPKPEYHALAFELRGRYGLTYFDSLHAAVAIFEGVELVSYDKRYSEVRELKYIHPSELPLQPRSGKTLQRCRIDSPASTANVST